MKRPSFQFYPQDWLSDPNVMAMTPAQRGGYIHLLALMWNTDECALKNDSEFLSKLCGLTDQDLRVVQGCFNQSPTDTTLLVHKRLIEERKKQDEWRQKSAFGGKKSAEKRLKQAKLKGGSRVVQPKGNSSSSSSSISPLPPNGGGGKLKLKFQKWLESIGIRNHEAIANKTFDEIPLKTIERAMADPACEDYKAFLALVHRLQP